MHHKDTTIYLNGLHICLHHFKAICDAQTNLFVVGAVLPSTRIKVHDFV